MQPAVKQTIAIVTTALFVVALYYGTYLPYMKSTSFITALAEARSTDSLEDFLAIFQHVVDRPSPVGQEEIVRNILTSFYGIVTQYGPSNPEVVKAIVPAGDSLYQIVAAEPSALSFAQTVSAIANLYDGAFAATQDPAYAAKAEQFYLRGLELSPNRPQFMYPIVNLYINTGRPEQAREYAEKIRALWPDDPRVAPLIDTL